MRYPTSYKGASAGCVNVLLKALGASSLQNSKKIGITALDTIAQLQKRIRSAKSYLSSHAAYNAFEQMVSGMKRHPTFIYGSAEEIFPGEEREDRAGYAFSQVEGRQQIDRLKGELSELPGSKDRWPFDVWLDLAGDREATIIEVKQEGNLIPAGFAVIKMDLELESNQNTVLIRLDLNSVYVTPSERGKGHSQALCWAVGMQVNRILSTLAQVPEESRGFLKDHKIEIFITGEAHSEGGARFLTNVVEQIESNMAFIDLKNAWFEVPVVIDDVDLDKFSRLARMR